MSIRILSVLPGSPAEAAGIQPEERLAAIGQEPILDEIDFQALSAASRFVMTVEDAQGKSRQVPIRKKEWEPVGICLDETDSMRPRHCRNHCLFCFIDQLPRGMRETLYVKDDDWRLSLMMGNYVTLTNVDDAEFDRILRRRASPLYISVQATDPQARVRLLRNPGAGNMLTRLRQLKEHDLEFHTQIVLCPGVNDGKILEKTLQDLVDLWPATRSIAIVPIGMTKHREHLEPMKPFTVETAAALLDQVSPWQQTCLERFGTRLVFPSDEFYCLSGRPIPPDQDYEDYVQIENGIGMLRQLERECREAAEDSEGAVPIPTQDPYLNLGVPLSPEEPEAMISRRLLIPTGTSAQPYIEALARQYAPKDTHVEVMAVHNRFFGESITVTGLIVGQDLIDALQGIPCDEILISATMLRENTDSFLDNVTLAEAQETLGVPLRVVENTGEDLIRALQGA